MKDNKVYRIGGMCALISFALTMFDIIFGSISSNDLTHLPETAIERFSEFNENWFLGLYHLDFLNAINSLVMITVFYSLFWLHKNKEIQFNALATLITFIGGITFICNNRALAMLTLSNKYFEATSDIQRELFASAGEALLVVGEHGSLGVFFGFFLSSLGSFLVALVMLKVKIVKKWISWFGVFGHGALLIYVVLISFIPKVETIAVIVAAPGGILALVWIFMVGLHLIKYNKPINYDFAI